MTYALALIAVVIIVALAQLRPPNQQNTRRDRTRQSTDSPGRDWKNAVYNPKQYRRPRGH